MHSRFPIAVVAASVAVVLAACAGEPPAKPARTLAPVATAAQLAGKPPAAAPAASKRMSGYTVKQRGGKAVYCKTELVTGSRTNATETCLTEEEMERARRGDLDLVRRLDENGGISKGATNASGGAVVDVMHP